MVGHRKIQLTHQVNPGRWNAAAQMAGKLRTVIYNAHNLSFEKRVYYLNKKRNTEEEGDKSETYQLL